MRELARQRREVREYGDFLHRKVGVARISVRNGLGSSNDKVEAEFSARRAGIAGQS